MKKVFLVMIPTALVCCVFLLCGATKQSAPQAEAPISADPVERYKILREKLHAAEKAQLNEIAHSTTDEALALMAQEQLIVLCLSDEQASTCEGILEMRGFDSPIVTVHGDSVNVILRAETLSQEECRVIMELICRETRVESDNIKIIPIN